MNPASVMNLLYVTYSGCKLKTVRLPCDVLALPTLTFQQCGTAAISRAQSILFTGVLCN